MGTVKVHAPVEGFTGEVAGVAFDDGVATVDKDIQAAALGYFERKGYGIGKKATAADVPEPPDPRDLGTNGDGIEPVGTVLRDAAVDPRPGDFLAPTNAGEANPHGPEAISPEVHGSQGVRPVRGGPVAVDDLDVQDAAEKAHTEDISPPPAVDQAVEVAGEPPARSASKADWVTYATAAGLAEATAEAMTRDELADTYRPKAQG